MCLLAGQHAHTSDGLDLLLGQGGEVLRLNNYGDSGEESLAEHLENTRFGHVDHDSAIKLPGLRLRERARGGERPQLVEVDGGAVLGALLFVEAPHADLSEVTGVELVHENAVVVLSSSVTAATGVGAVLADAAVASADVSALLAVLGHTGRL